MRTIPFRLPLAIAGFLAQAGGASRADVLWLSWADEMDDDLGAVFVWLAILGGIVVWSNWDSDNIVGRVRHQIAYSVPYSEVHMQARPKDCNFWGAPVGMKDCSYERLVTAYNAAGEVVPGDKPRYDIDRNTGKPIVSYDDGKSWAWAPAISDHTVERIDVQWRRVAN